VKAKQRQILRYLENRRMEELEAYAKRGRPLARLDDSELRQAFVMVFKVLANDPSNETAFRALRSIQPEFTLRRQEIPYDLVKEDLDGFVMRINEGVQKILANPVDTYRIDSELEEDLASFEEQANRSLKS